MNKPSTKTRGFTLVEILTATAVFLVVMTISMGSILHVFDSNRRASSMRAVMANINLAVESMSREMRFGQNYHCGSGGTLTQPQNCAGGANFVSFLGSDGSQIVYRFNNGSIEKSVDSGSTYVALTSPEVAIDSLTFYTLGAGANNPTELQPKTLIKIKGHSGTGKSQSDFTLQTLVSQRRLDS